jgi:peptidoglycan hydrolase CwlO-like protein
VYSNPTMDAALQDSDSDSDMKLLVRKLLDLIKALTKTTTLQTQQFQGEFEQIRRSLHSVQSAFGSVKQELKELKELKLEVAALKKHLDEESNSLRRHYRSNQSPFRANSGYVNGQHPEYDGFPRPELPPPQYALIPLNARLIADL